jgi:hypothetical protein
VASKSDSDSRLCFHLRNVIKETPAPAIIAISTLAPRNQGKHERYYGIFTNTYLKVYMSLKTQELFVFAYLRLLERRNNQYSRVY